MKRRRFLQLAVALPALWAMLERLRTPEAWASAARAAIPPGTSRAALPPTPDCDDGDETPAETEGPFYKPRSPRRSSLIESGLAGTRIVLTGRVLSHHCEPVNNALLDFWHADSNGDYDNDGFRCRGHQYTDAEGRYRLETVVPGLYPGRTRHFHVKVQGPGARLLTTQLYFPREPRNSEDSLFRAELLMRVRSGVQRRDARFDFVIEDSSRS